MKKCEYLVADNPTLDQMNQLGEIGWELITVVLSPKPPEFLKGQTKPVLQISALFKKEKI